MRGRGITKGTVSYYRLWLSIGQSFYRSGTLIFSCPCAIYGGKYALYVNVRRPGGRGGW